MATLIPATTHHPHNFQGRIESVSFLGSMKESLRTMPSHATFEADNPKKQQTYFTAQTERPQVPQQEYIPLKQVLGSWMASRSRPKPLPEQKL